MIEPKTTQPINNDYDEYTNIDSTTLANTISKKLEQKTVVVEFIEEPKNTNIIIPDESNIIDKIQSLNILQLTIATDIIEKIPIGISRLFLNDIDALYCYTAVDNALKNNKIIHNWKYNEQDFFKGFIVVGDSPNWRCWSKITIKPEMTGDWQVIVTDTLGNQLDSIEFSIIPIRE